VHCAGGKSISILPIIFYPEASCDSGSKKEEQIFSTFFLTLLTQILPLTENVCRNRIKNDPNINVLK